MRALSRKAHRPFLIGLAAALATATGFVAADLPHALVAAVDAFFLGFLVAGLADVAGRNKDWASRDDEPAILFFLVAIGFAAVGLFLLFREVNREIAQPAAIVLALMTLPLGWLTVHVMAGFHYARLYNLEQALGERLPLEFPGNGTPDAWDFLYFSFVIGMTAQTSDVQIRSRRLRRFALLHGVLSFMLNTVVVAAAVNIVVNIRS